MSGSYRAPCGPIRQLYGDCHILVVSKPAGLLSVPGRGPEKADCLQARIGAQFPGARAVHRLDMETSGLIVLARTARAHRRLSMAFAGRGVHKVYVARVAGHVPDPAGEIDLPLAADWPHRPRQKVDPATGKPSLTRFERLCAGRNESRLELSPVTGRTHQLRVHLAAIGHPILGDSLYGDAESRNAAPRLQLHACALGFAHPEYGAALRFTEPAAF